MNPDTLPPKLRKQFGPLTVGKAKARKIEARKGSLIGLDEKAAHFIDPWLQQLAFELDDARGRILSANCNSQHRFLGHSPLPCSVRECRAFPAMFPTRDRNFSFERFLE